MEAIHKDLSKDLSKSLPNIPSDDLSHEDRQLKIKFHQRCDTVLPEYRSEIDELVDSERKKVTDDYIYTDKWNEFLASNQDLPPEFDVDMRFDTFPYEYLFTVQESHQGKVIYTDETPFLLDYAGFLWSSISGLLYCILHGFRPSSKEFEEIALKYHQRPFGTSTGVARDWSIFPWDNHAYIKEKFEIFFGYLFKDETRFYIRYMNFFKSSIIHSGGLRFMSEEIFNAVNANSPCCCEVVEEMFLGKLDGLSHDLVILENPIAVNHNIRLPLDRPSLEHNAKLPPLVVAKDWNDSIYIFKVIEDSIPDEMRLTPQEAPYVDSALYNPPITRGVSNEVQPFRFVYANGVINPDKCSADTTSMRQKITEDFLTKALDWAAKNNLPLPYYGSEVYLHLDDEISEDLTEFFMGAYSRRRRHANKIALFPEYSYQVFSTTSRFDTVGSYSSSWGDIKNLILRELKSNNIKPTIPKIFFRGNDASITGIRRDLWCAQKSNLRMLPPKTLQMVIPNLDQTTPPIMQIYEMGKYKVLLDLPGIGMWSTRLKFICLTESHVLRIIHYKHHWDPVNLKWIPIDPNLDIYETFADTFLPIEETHTIIGDVYLRDGVKSPAIQEDRKKLNMKSKNRILDKIGEFYKSVDSAATKKKTERVRKIAMDLSDDDIMRYTYNFIMLQQEYYYGVSEHSETSRESDMIVNDDDSESNHESSDDNIIISDSVNSEPKIKSRDLIVENSETSDEEIEDSIQKVSMVQPPTELDEESDQIIEESLDSSEFDEEFMEHDQED